MSLLDRKFTWARSTGSQSKALLDRFFCISTWFSHYPNSVVTSLPRAFSDHNPIVPKTSSTCKTVRFERIWLSQEGFSDLVIQWWNSFILNSDLGNSWKFKLQFFRKKLRGWNANLQGEKRKIKQNLLSQIDYYENLHDSNF